MAPTKTAAGFSGRPLLWFGLVASALLSGCASVPPPDNAMNRAESALEAAREARAADYAPVDLDFAKARFDQAQAAMAARKYAEAADRAAESQADSQLALTKARLGALRDQIQTHAQQNASLRQRLLDKPASASPAPTPSSRQLPDQVLPAPADAGSAGDAGGFQPFDDSQGGDL